MRRIINQMKLHTSLVNNTIARVRFGVVSSYDPDNYCCKVQIQPEGTETGWLPIASPWVGAGWGLFAPPSLGDMVDVHYQEGDFQAGYVELRFFNDEERPVHCEPGVFYLIHKSGSTLKFNNDGTVDLIANGQLNIQSSAETHLAATKFVVNAPMQVNSTVTTTGKITGGADIQAAANVSDQGGAKTMANMRSTYNGHHHSSSTTPTEQM